MVRVLSKVNTGFFPKKIYAKNMCCSNFSLKRVLKDLRAACLRDLGPGSVPADGGALDHQVHSRKVSKDAG